MPILARLSSISIDETVKQSLQIDPDSYLVQLDAAIRVHQRAAIPLEDDSASLRGNSQTPV